MGISAGSVQLISKWMFNPWRFVVIAGKILIGVYYSKFLPPFIIKYRVSYVIIDAASPSAIVNIRIPPQVNDRIDLPDGTFEVNEIQMLTSPRDDFCFLQAICRKVQ